MSKEKAKQKKYNATRILIQCLSIIIVLFVFMCVWSAFKPQMDIWKMGEECYKIRMVEWCNEKNMEYSTKIITPTGLFGGTPYDKPICKNNKREIIIQHKEVNKEKCE